MTEESSNEAKLGHGSRKPSEWFTYKKASTTNDCRRIAFRRDMRGAEKSVVKWSTVCKFSVGNGVFNPSFSKTTDPDDARQ